MVEGQMIEWIKKNKIILLVVLLALFLRLYRISSYMTFLGDEGRDALVWLRMLQGKFTLIGPQTSIGNMYLGPLYYYLMLPFYILLGTVGPSIGVALFAGATTFLIWLFGKAWFSERVGLIAAFLYAISPVAIVLSRSSWNPNVMPFFALLTVWGIWQFWQKEKYLWLPICGILISFAVQSHYMGLLFIPIVSVFWIVKLWQLIKGENKRLKKFLLYSALSVFFFILLTVAPLVWFDLRHNFINYKAFYKFFSERQTTVNLKAYKAIPQMWPLWVTLVTRLLAGKIQFIGGIISFLIILSPFLILPLRLSGVKGKEESKSFLKPRPALLLLFVWLVLGLLGMGLYKQHIYDHYFGFLFPSLFLLFSYILEGIWLIRNYPYWGFGGPRFSLYVILLLVFIPNIMNNPLKDSPNFQLQRTETISKKIVQESAGRPFNLGMIAKQNYDAGYRYFLEKWGRKPVEIDAQRSQQTITEQLFVVCEEKECNPTTHPQAEIANFGWSEIEKEWEFPWGVRLFKLVHYKKAK